MYIHGIKGLTVSCTCISVLQYLDMGQHQMALNAWRNATLLKPKHLNAWSNMVILLDNIGQCSEMPSFKS